MTRKLTDLNKAIYSGMPVYLGHKGTAIFDVKNHEEAKELNKPGMHTSTAMGILICDHGPTHVDAFIHRDPSPNAEIVDQLPLELFYPTSICLEVSHWLAGEYIRFRI